MTRILKNITVFILIVLIALAFYSFSNRDDTVVDLSYSEFRTEVESGRIKAVNIAAETDAGRYIITGTLKDGKSFQATTFPDNAIGDFLTAYGVDITYDAVVTSWWLSILGTLIPMLIIVGLFIFLMQQGQGAGGKVMQFGKSRAKLQTDSRKKVTFDDVAGVDEVKEELQEIIGFLKDPRKYNALGARIPKGVLLMGPPGTGKTLIAKAVAG